MPPAFVLSQDQTLKLIIPTRPPARAGNPTGTLGASRSSLHVVLTCQQDTQNDEQRRSLDTTPPAHPFHRSEEHTSELQSLMRTSYAVFCLKKKKSKTRQHN